MGTVPSSKALPSSRIYRGSANGTGSDGNSFTPLHNLCMETARQCPEVTPDKPAVTPWQSVFFVVFVLFRGRNNQHQTECLPSRLDLQTQPWIFHRICVRVTIMIYFGPKAIWADYRCVLVCSPVMPSMAVYVLQTQATSHPRMP